MAALPATRRAFQVPDGKLQKAGKGIILMHDLPQILDQFQKNGFKVVHLVPKGALTTLAQYDEAVLKENKLPILTNQPAESVVRTIPRVTRRFGPAAPLFNGQPWPLG